MADPSELHSPSSESAAITVYGDGDPLAPQDLVRHDVLGRYLLLDELGTGGMGAVYRAYDPKLRREVALKLLHRSSDSTAGARMLREAQAMAQLSHPNVVPVYDVEQSEDQIFIAMELVAGTTLRGWAESQKKRSWQEIVTVFAAAGRGLAAAHAAGLVHRDFKPANVMVGDDGRIRVMDFGLARGSGGAVAPTLDASGSGDDLVPEDAVTVAGIVMGTPVYMAPEQHKGRDFDHRADQFAFCVALYEALAGTRPFDAPTPAKMYRRKKRGSFSGELRGPRWLRQAVMRGLQFDPSRRFGSMDELLRALDRGRRRAIVRWSLLGVGLVASIAATVGLTKRSQHLERVAACEADAATIDSVWNDDARERVSAAIRATGLSYADATATNVMPWLVDYAASWQDAAREVCMQARVDDSMSEQLFERASWCLAERKMTFEALVSELEQTADANVVRRAVVSAATLPRIEPCRDAHSLERFPVPERGHDEAQAIERMLSRVSVLFGQAKYDEAEPLLEEARQRAEDLGWPPLLARIRYWEGKAAQNDGDYKRAAAELRQAYLEAMRDGAMETAWSIAVSLTYVVGDRLSLPEEGRLWAGLAKLAGDEAGDVLGLRDAYRLQNLGGLARTNGELDEARELQEQSLAIYERVLGPEHPKVADSLNDLANAHFSKGEFQEALPLHERALAIRESAFGPEHPKVATSLNNLAGVVHATGDPKRSQEQFERALAIRENAFGADHPNVASSLTNLGNVHLQHRDYERALGYYERALPIYEQAFGPKHPRVADNLNNIASVYQSQGRDEEAVPLFQRAHDIYVEVKGPEHPAVASTLNNLASMQLSAGALEDAKLGYQRALELREKSMGPDAPALASPLIGLAHVALEQARPEAAVKFAERAVELSQGGETHEAATARFVLARALWEAGPPTRPRALELARSAKASFETEAGWHESIADVQRWLDERD